MTRATLIIHPNDTNDESKTVQAVIDHLDRIVGSGADDIRPSQLAPLRTHLVGLRDEPEDVTATFDVRNDEQKVVVEILPGTVQIHTKTEPRVNHG